MPGQPLSDLPGRVVGDAGEDVGKIVLRVEAIEFGSLELFAGNRIAEAACWAHVRRKFFDVPSVSRRSPDAPSRSPPAASTVAPGSAPPPPLRRAATRIGRAPAAWQTGTSLARPTTTA
jgi:hypothetical protein